LPRIFCRAIISVVETTNSKKQRKRGPGRPAFRPDCVNVGVRMDRRLWRDVTRCARRERRTRTAVVEEALRRYLEEEGR